MVVGRGCGPVRTRRCRWFGRRAQARTRSPVAPPHRVQARHEVRALGRALEQPAPLDPARHHVVERVGGIQARTTRHSRDPILGGVAWQDDSFITYLRVP